MTNAFTLLIDNLMRSTDDITGAAVLTTDGLILEANVAPGTNPDKMAALSAAMLGLAKKFTADLHFGKLSEVQIRADNAVFLIRAVEDKVLAIAARPNANLGILNLAVQRAIPVLQREPIGHRWTAN